MRMKLACAIIKEEYIKCYTNLLYMHIQSNLQYSKYVCTF